MTGIVNSTWLTQNDVAYASRRGASARDWKKPTETERNRAKPTEVAAVHRHLPPESGPEPASKYSLPAGLQWWKSEKPKSKTLSCSWRQRAS